LLTGAGRAWPRISASFVRCVWFASHRPRKRRRRRRLFCRFRFTGSRSLAM